MSDINEKQRPELKSYFLAYSIPTQKNFEDLIDATIIEGEDPIAARPDSPIMIRISGGHENREEFLHFYDDFEDDAPLWILGQDASTKNFEIATMGGTRLSIGNSDGSLAINTIDGDHPHRAQLDVHTEGNETLKSLVIAGDTDNYLSILSPTTDNAKVVIGGNIGDDNETKAKLHVTLNDTDVNPLVIEGSGSENFLCINSSGFMGVNIAVGSDFLTEQFNVRGNIKVGNSTATLYLKNDAANNPTLFSKDTPDLLRIISDNGLAFWAGSPEDITTTTHLMISNESGKEGNVGIGIDDPTEKLHIVGGTLIEGTITTTGLGAFPSIDVGTGTFDSLTIGDTLTINGSGINHSDTLLLEGTNGVEIVDTNTMHIEPNKVRIGTSGSQSSEVMFYLNGDMCVEGHGIVDFSKLNDITTVQFRTASIHLSRNNSGDDTSSSTVTFSGNLEESEAVIKGTDIKYTSGGAKDSNNIHGLKARISGKSESGNSVTVTVAARLASGSNPNKGENWTATVEVLVIGIVKPS